MVRSPRALALICRSVFVAHTNVLFLVEDEALIQMLLEDALTDAGFDLIIVRDGAKALSELESDAARFRGVITDINLGSGPDGWQVGRRARELVAGMPVVYMSGDSANGWSSRGVPNSLMVSKPFAVAQIVTAISTLLIQADAHPV
jgi:DNA-binding response OmpR family regulator